MSQARCGGNNGGTTQNKYVTFFSHMDEKADIDMGLNKVFVPKTKQDSYGSKDYLLNEELSTAPFDHKFGVASHSIHGHDSKTDSRNQMKHQNIQEAFISNIAKEDRRSPNHVHSI